MYGVSSAKTRQQFLRQVASDLNIFPSTVHGILTKVSARWVPKLLPDKEKQTHARCSVAFSEQYAAEGDTFLDRIVTANEHGSITLIPRTVNADYYATVNIYIYMQPMYVTYQFIKKYIYIIKSFI